MSNRLATETSPYLRQHADNPVDWWPWGAAALREARAQGKPILLSIGYSACHWCHVMAHESFEDEATARVMNALYVNIKVDREERPDLDKIYQLSHQALTRRGGGWPLTLFLSPDDLVPFYAGTYFPKEPRYGMPPFAHVLEQVRGYWDQRRDDVRAQTAALAEFLRDYDRSDVPAAAPLDDTPLRSARTLIARNFDREFGGHHGAPKFPHCPEMELLLDLDEAGVVGAAEAMAREPSSLRGEDGGAAHAPAGDRNGSGGSPAGPRAMVELTLARMAAGGIHDQIGGGFCRYSVDERWEIPHFEKMLYDNAQLLPLLVRTARGGGGTAMPVGAPAEDRSHPHSGAASDGPDFVRIAHELLAWLVREMTAPDGAFYTALDADSEHEEGKYYVWTREEVRAVLDAEEFAVAERYFGFDRPPNFEGKAWNPIVAVPVAGVAAALGIAADVAAARLADSTRKLFAVRARRVRPGLDDKILTATNSLMIAGIARAARMLDAPPLVGLADNALDALHAGAWRDGRLFAKAGGDAARFPAYLDDHALLLDALLECLQCRWSDRDLAWAVAIAEDLLTRFEDREHGGFFFTAHDHEPLPQRPKPWIDEAVPSGNGVAARALLRLGHLLGEPRWLDAAERTLRAAYSTMQQMPHACPSLLRALNDFLQPRTHVVVRYAGDAEEAVWRAAVPAAPAEARRVDLYCIPERAAAQVAVLAAQTYAPGGVAYVCRGTQCLPPIADATRLAAACRGAPPS